MDEPSASSSSVRKHFEKNKGAGYPRGYCYVKTLLELVEVEREYDKQLWNHIKGQHASAFASKTVLSTCCTHPHSSLHILFFSTLVGKNLIIILIYSCSHYSRIFDYSLCGYRIIQFAQNEYSFHPCFFGNACAGRVGKCFGAYICHRRPGGSTATSVLRRLRRSLSQAALRTIYIRLHPPHSRICLSHVEQLDEERGRLAGTIPATSCSPHPWHTAFQEGRPLTSADSSQPPDVRVSQSLRTLGIRTAVVYWSNPQPPQGREPANVWTKATTGHPNPHCPYLCLPRLCHS